MRIAIVGGGVSGLGAAWALNEHAGKHEVHLFEAGEYVGGHTNTVEFRKPSGGGEAREPVMVDTGFIVFNEVTYPNFLAFIRHLGIEIIASDMSFAVSRTSPLVQPQALPSRLATFFPSLPRTPNTASAVPGGSNGRGSSKNQSATSTAQLDRGAFEWAGNSLSGLFCQPSNIVSPAHWRMVWDVVRFNYQSIASLRQYDQTSEVMRAETPFAHQSIGSWLDERGYSRSFARNYLIPMAACIWSTPADDTFDKFPALTLLRFMHNHHLLQILYQPQWLTLKGGSQTYVRRVLSKLPSAQIHQGSKQGKVVKARRGNTKEGDQSNASSSSSSEWRLTTADGQEHVFDRIVFAAHADTTAAILEEELVTHGGKEGLDLKAALDSFEFNKNTATLHADEELMPVRRAAWSSWNFLAETNDDTLTDKPGVTLTYWMNLLQSLPEEKHGPVLVTLNAPEGAARAEKVLAKYSYEHPVYTAQSVAAQRKLKSAWPSGYEGAHFAGAWTSYGFHEDGFASGLRAAHALGATPPFEMRHAERSLQGPNVRIEHIVGSLVEVADKYVRRPLAPIFLPYLLAPIAVSLAFILELLADAAMLAVVGRSRIQSTRCGIRNELRLVRFTWEQTLPRPLQRAVGSASASRSDQHRQ